MTEDIALGLAATKLRPPAPPRRLVRRSRLDDVLDVGVEQGVPLILLSAPAGSGKSTLLGSWLASRSEPVAWLQAEASDSDPARFWSYLVEAIGRVVPALAEEVQPIVTGSSGDEAVVVPALINSLAASGGPLLLVIDDYHLIESVSVHRGVQRLVDLCPSQVSLVLATRFDPPFRIGRLRVRGRLAEVRAAELRFDAAEAADLLDDARRDLDPSLVSQLCDRTEGWAAGLVLAGFSLERAPDPRAFVTAFRGDDQLIVEYFQDELLSGLDAKDCRIFLETSILEQLNGDLVSAVTGEIGGSDWLRQTAQANQLLVGLDRTGTWFRYHHLLRDLLLRQAQEVLPERLPDLHGRAAAWFEAEGDHERAIGHRLAAGDRVAAAQLMRVLGPRLLRGGQTETLGGLLAQLGEVVSTDVACALLSGWFEFISGRYAAAEQRLENVLEIAPPGFDELLTRALRINISLARGDVGTALTAARTLSRDEMIVRPSDLATAVGAAYAWAGVADQAVASLDLAVERAAAEGSRSVRVLALVYRAVTELESGSNASAYVASTTAVETAQRFGLAEYHGVAPAYAIRARTADDPVQSREDAAHALRSARRSSTRLALAYVLTICGDTLLRLEDPAGRPLLAEARSVIAGCPDPGVVGQYLAQADSRHRTGSDATRRAPGLVDQLTERETAVLRYLPTPMTQRDIASELYVSLNTVKTHCQAIYRKLGVEERKAAVHAARNAGLL